MSVGSKGSRSWGLGVGIRGKEVGGLVVGG